MYLVNESSKLESVNRVHEIGEKSHSLLDHPRIRVAKTKALISFAVRSYCEADLRLCFHLCRLLVFPCGGSYFFASESQSMS